MQLLRWDFQSCGAWTQDQQSHQLTLPVWESCSHETPTQEGTEVGLLPREPQRQACSQWAWRAETEPLRSILKVWSSNKLAPVNFGLIWYLSLLSSSPLEWELLPSDMGMSIPCLFHYYILEAYNLFGYTDSQLETNLLKDKLYFKSHPHLI